MHIIIMILLIFQLLRKWSLNIEDKHTRQSISKWGLLKTRKVLNFKSVAVYMSIMLAHHILRILFFHIKNIKAKNNKILEEKFMKNPMLKKYANLMNFMYPVQRFTFNLAHMLLYTITPSTTSRTRG